MTTRYTIHTIYLSWKKGMRTLVPLTLILLVGLTACSTKKNTASTRAYHEMCTRYNVGFNAKNSFIEGEKSINDNNNDDFTKLINMYPITNSGGGAASQMDRTIEKCRKAIKKHSITKKPAKDSKKMKDPKYAYFFNQEEYVKGVKEAWILLGKAELNKGDFLGAASTFGYILRHYPSDLEIVCEARIWQARAYAEMNWMYEAQEVFDKIKEDDVTKHLNRDYALTQAFLLLRSGNGKGAIPFLQIGEAKSKGRFYTSRYNYLLGQLYFAEANRPRAGEYFKKAARQAPSYPMEFNAKLMMLQCEKDKWRNSVKKLERMLRSPNNKEYLDQIYTSIGNIYLVHSDTTRAIENYKLGIENSTRSGVEKAVTLITLGDLYYSQRQYVDAAPCYTEAATIINTEHDDYQRVSTLGETLGLLASAYETVVLQDSLQHLATLTPEEQQTIVDQIIVDVIRQEEEEARKAEEEATKGFVESTRLDMSNASIGGSNDWYFYNAQLKQQGATQFRQKWGTRKLEDNWRRTNKTAPIFASAVGDSGDDALGGDTPQLADGQQPATDPTIPAHHQPQYYLSQIPSTPDAIAASDALIVEALYSMAEIYDTRLHDYPAAADTYDTCRYRFPTDSRTLEGLYVSYRIAGRRELDVQQAYYRQQIIDSFPDSKYAAMLSQPDYVEHALAMLQMQDSLYEDTYTAYTKGDHATVAANYHYMADTYPLSDLMPKFAFLNAMAIGKSSPGAPFRTALSEIIEKYPQSDVTPMSKDILALIGQGVEAQESKTTESIADRRAEIVEETVDEKVVEFEFDARTAYHLLLIPRTDGATDFNTLLYDVAAFNFTKFMIKDFDIAQSSIDNLRVIDISQLESLDEARWYETMLLAEPSLQGRVTLDKIERIAISDNNLNVIVGGRTLADYIDWWQQQTSESSHKSSDKKTSKQKSSKK